MSDLFSKIDSPNKMCMNTHTKLAIIKIFFIFFALRFNLSFVENNLHMLLFLVCALSLPIIILREIKEISNSFCMFSTPFHLRH